RRRLDQQDVIGAAKARALWTNGGSSAMSRRYSWWNPAAEAFAYGRMQTRIHRFEKQPLTGTPRAGTRPRQQYRPGASRAEEEDAARRHFPRDEDARTLREAFREARTRKGRSGAPRTQAGAQARPARRPCRRWAGRGALSAH